jgi:soluble lytic murein transglycosylase
MGVTPFEATAARRRGGRRRAGRRRFGRVAGVVLVAVLAVVAVVLGTRAERHFSLPLEYASIIRTQAHQKRLDPAFVAAVIYAETRFRPRTSKTGAVGLMQIEPVTAEFLAKRSGATTFTVADLGTPAVNIAYGSYYLRYLLDEYDGSAVLALAAYNGGETNVNRWLAKARTSGTRFTVAQIPIAQTKAYVNEVLGAQRRYRAKYAQALGYT